MYSSHLNEKLIVEQAFKLKIGTLFTSVDGKVQEIWQKFGKDVTNDLESLRISCYKAAGLHDFEEVEALECRRAIRSVRKIAIKRNNGHRTATKTCNSCHQTMNYDDDCRCLIEAGRQISLKFQRSAAKKASQGVK